MTPLSRAEWLNERRRGIGSSDVAAVLGLSPWKTALDVYLDKIQPVDPTARMSPHLEWGIRKEPIIAAAIKDHYGWAIAKPVTTAHAEFPFLLASPDRVNDNGELIEIKTASSREGWGERETNDIPDQYWLQCQHQMEVMSSTRPDMFQVCWVFVLIDSDFRRYRIERDPGYLEMSLEPLTEFWGMVERRTPPTPDWGHSATLGAVNRLFQPTESSRYLEPDVCQLVEDYEVMGQQVKSLQDQRDLLKSRIIHAMGDAGTAYIDDRRMVTRKEVRRIGYTVEPTTYIDFRIKKVKK